MPTTSVLRDEADKLFERLVGGDEDSCRGLLFGRLVQQGVTVLSLCETMTSVFHRIGDAWECAQLDVYREHVATQIAWRLLADLRDHMQPPDRDAPMAIGCTPEQDPYSLPTCMVELVLRELGWNAKSLGTNLSLELLVPAFDDLQPHLCWVSVSHVESTARLKTQLSNLGEQGQRRGIRIICGGRAVDKLEFACDGVEFLDRLSDLLTLPKGRRTFGPTDESR